MKTATTTITTMENHKTVSWPTIIAGGIGGPFCIFILTPFRNALTIASQDRTSGVIGVYRETIGAGSGSLVRSMFAKGWAGGLYPVLPAIPQFLVLGPCYHLFVEHTNPYSALFLTGATETIISFGSNARNAEEAYRTRIGAKQPSISPTSVYKFWGSGAVPHLARNTIAMAGMRILSPIIKEKTGCSYTVADFSASMVTGALSMPFNQLFNYYAVEHWKRRQINSLAVEPDFKDGIEFLKKQYMGGSSTLARDVIIRSVYATFLFGMYAGIERKLIEKHKLGEWPFNVLT